MDLVTGSRLGPYEIVAPLGAGGMGEVFKARDTRLERSVAIKDGRWIVDQPVESGKPRVYVLAVSAGLGKWQISTDGGARPRWRRDGKVIFYVSPDWKQMAVDVSARGDESSAGLSKPFGPPL